MYYNPYSNYWGVCPYMPSGGYPMGDAMKHYYQPEAHAPKGMREMLHKIMETEFYVVELALYLDTHPKDENAIKVFNEAVCRLDELKEAYREKYGPLTHYEKTGCPYQYVQGPWPWEL